MIILSPEEIGGARVRRTFKWGTTQVFAGHTLTADQVRSMPIANRNALIENRFIEVWQKPPAVEGVGRHLVHRGRGMYDVIEGLRLNEEPLSQEEAEELATRPISQ